MGRGGRDNGFTLAEVPAVKRRAFTLIELLIVIAIVGLLASMLLPSLASARRLARITKARAELRGIGTSLECYESMEKAIPPVRADCNADMIGHEFQLPVELAEGGYLPAGADLQRMVAVEDPFNADHTYKYNAPGPIVVNGSPMPTGNRLWVPDAFPHETGPPTLSRGDDGTSYRTQAESPVRWVLWSMGPGGAESAQARSERGAVSMHTWYGVDGRDQGLIVRVRDASGLTHASP